MCGIAGFVNFSGHDRQKAQEEVQRMSDLLVHRGPDACGYYVDGYAALGHRRLSIIDLATGHQPMGAVNNALQIVFNGEIYNFRELRADLEAKGHRFQTQSDTEVILLGYRQWGEACVERLAGMFAFAIWDVQNRKLFLARDRVGKKPLYYLEDGESIFFASELKSILAVLETRPQISSRALDCYFSFGYIPSPMTVFETAKKLPPASTLTMQNGVGRLQKYWQLDFSSPSGGDDAQVLEEFENIFDHAVSTRLVSEVPLGAFLSGGLDSSLVVASMAKSHGRDVVTNSIGFNEADFNELPVAREVAEHLRTDHHEFVVQSNAAEIISKIAWHFDEPFADSSAVPTWYVCQMARQNVTVALSGDGGDEGFGGYTFRYLPHMVEAKLRSAIPVWLRGPFCGLLGACYPGSAKLPKYLRLKTIFENLSVSDAEAYYNDLVFLRSDIRGRLYAREFKESLKGFSPFELVAPLYSRGDDVDPLSRSQQTDISFYMTEDVLVKVDRMSMAHSLEVRSPLLDHKVLEFAARLSTRQKVNNGQGKILLRNLAAKRLPPQILNLPKRGFSIPAARWLRNELKEMAGELILNNNSLVADYLIPAQVEKIWAEHQAGVRDHNVFLWGLMMFGLWEKNFYSRTNT